MANPYFQAKVLWESGRREEGLAVINDFLESRIQQPVFRPSSRIFRYDSLASWEAAFTVLFSNSDMLVAPFARVFPFVWTMYPSLQMICLLVEQDFVRQPDIPDYLAELEGLDNFDYQHTTADFAGVSSTLATAAETGILRPTTDEYSRVGFPYLTMEQIASVSRGAGGELGAMLVVHLPEAFAACPADFCAQQAKQDTLGFVSRFLQNVFGAEHPTLQTSRMSLERIVKLTPMYHNALISGIDTVLEHENKLSIGELVRYNANLPKVEEPHTWLSSLVKDLRLRQFDTIIKKTASIRS